MIKTALTTPMLRYGFIVLLIALIFSGSLYLSLRFTRAQTLQNDINRLVEFRENSELTDSCIALLSSAESDSRLFWVTGDTTYLSQVSVVILRVPQLLEQLAPDRFRLRDLLENTNAEGKYLQSLQQLAKGLAQVPAHLQAASRNKENPGEPQDARTIDRVLHDAGTGRITALISGLKTYQHEQKSQVHTRKKELKGTLMMAVSEFSRLSLFALVILVILVCTVFYHIWKIFRNEKKLARASERSNHYAAGKSSFLAGMSHEIRTPLNSIIGFAEQLDKDGLNSTQSEQVSAIRTSSAMLLDVVNQILDFSKYETGKVSIGHSPFILSLAITEVLNSMKILAEKKGLNLKKELEIDQELCLAGDAFRLKQVLLNLLGNAVKFTAQGEVLLKVWVKEGENGQVVLHVEVKDSGIGIDKEHIASVFNEFSQVGTNQPEHHKGTGLGLAICKKIVESQGGSITVRSEPGKGSVFSFWLPFERFENHACLADTASPDLSIIYRLSGKHVLLAEDNQMNVLLAKTILQKWGMKCQVAYNGKEALSLFEQGAYDLVLTDIEMPEMGGVELVRHIRLSDDPLKAAIPVIAVTAHVMKEDHDKYLQAGMDLIAVKPFLEKDLVESIMAAFDKVAVNV